MFPLISVPSAIGRLTKLTVPLSADSTQPSDEALRSAIIAAEIVFSCPAPVTVVPVIGLEVNLYFESLIVPLASFIAALKFVFVVPIVFPLIKSSEGCVI